MAGSVNKVILVGNLGKDPEVRFSPDGRRVAAETLARIAGRQVELWEVTTGKPLVKLR